MNTWTNNTDVKKAQVHPLVLQRKRLGIKQQALADLTGLGITTIKRAEYGDKISPYTISAICSFFSERLKRQFQPEELFLTSQWQEAEINILNSSTTTEKNTSVGLQKRMANHYQPFAPIESSDFFSFGNLVTKLIILDGNGTEAYDPQNISTFYDPRPVTFLEDIQQIKAQIEEEQTQAKKDEKLLPWNGQIYHLANYQLSREPIHEHMRLNLWFSPTDYFTVLAKNRYLKNTKSQDKYLTDDLNISSFDIPIPFGVGLSIITSDGYIIFAQREGNLGVRPGYFMTSVEEGLSRPVDRGTTSDAPDLYRCACRGLSEELGLVEKRDFSISDIQFLGLGMDTEFFMCGLRGLLKLRLDAHTVIKNWETGVKDKIENRRLLAIPFTLENVCDFVLNHSPWGGGALMGTYHTLVHEFGKKQANAAIASHYK